MQKEEVFRGAANQTKEKKSNLHVAMQSLQEELYYVWRKLAMWIITVHSKSNLTVFEFDNQKEAKEAFKRIQGYKILTEVIYFNDHSLVEA